MSDRERWNTAIFECIEWAKSPKLEKAHSTSLHRVMGALRDHDMIYPPGAPAAEAARYYTSILDHPYISFVIAHDWARAFEGAENFDLASAFDLSSETWDFRTPYPDCCWEFRLSGKPVNFLTRFIEEQLTYQVSAVVETSVGWTGLPLTEERNVPISRMLFEQVRAVCISLDAQVSTTEVIRAPYKLNAAREKRGVLPIPEYHIVKLNRRSHPEPLPDGMSDGEPRRRLRLHFRRGHWRHFDTYKTWIKWTLVGDPDLGSIDKHYSL